MFTRESEMVKNLKVTRRTGMVKFASTLPVEEELEIDSSPAAKRVLNKFKKSPDIPKGYVQEHEEKLTKGEKPKEVVTQFFEGLQDVKAKNQLMIITAKLFRQHGIFKTAEKDVYQDLKTGDFWKISDDKKSVMRMFQEIDGVADRASDRHSVMQKAALKDDEEATADEPWKPSEKEEAYFQKKDVERKKQKFQQPQSGF